MRIQTVIQSIDDMVGSWVRTDDVRRTPAGIDLRFGVHEGQRGRRIAGWKVACTGVHETHITELDGGGLALYSRWHPAARQYAAREAELRWSRRSDEARVLWALHWAHVEAVDDWIPFDRYLPKNGLWNASSRPLSFAIVSGNRFACRGPEFLLRVYAKALREGGEETELVLLGNARAKAPRPRVLHFGSSYVVADGFTAERESEE